MKYKRQDHTFPGTIQRYIFKDDKVPTQINIWLIWKGTEMPDEITRERNLSAFKEALADVLDWETAHMSTKEEIIYA